jgi:hypothetical protein
MKWSEELLRDVEILEFIKLLILKMEEFISVRLNRLSKSVGVLMLNEVFVPNLLLIINYMPPCGKRVWRTLLLKF